MCLVLLKLLQWMLCFMIKLFFWTFSNKIWLQLKLGWKLKLINISLTSLSKLVNGSFLGFNHIGSCPLILKGFTSSLQGILAPFIFCRELVKWLTSWPYPLVVWFTQYCSMSLALSLNWVLTLLPFPLFQLLILRTFSILSLLSFCSTNLSNLEVEQSLRCWSSAMVSP